MASAATSTTAFGPRDASDFDARHKKSNNSTLPPLNPSVQLPPTLLAEIAFVGVLCSTQLLTQAALGQAISTLHIIGSDFGSETPSQLSWIPAAYSLTVGTFILIAGRIGDLYGHKKILIGGFIWFGLWSLIAGCSAFSKSLVFFDICRACQGIGPAFLLPNALAILGRTYPDGLRKQMVFSIFGATAPSGFALGATFSALLSQLAWWPWAFWVMGITCLVVAFVAWFAIPETPNSKTENSNSTKILTQTDALGGVTGIIGLILINFAWNQSAVVSWKAPYIYILLVTGFVFLGFFAFIEIRVEYPLIPRDALTSDSAFVLGCIAAGWSSFGIWAYYTWQFLEELRLATPLLASGQFSPVSISGLVAALSTGILLHKVPPSVIMLVAMVAFTAGGILMATAPVGQTYWAQTFVSLIVMCFGMDMSFPAATILLSNKMQREHQGVAASLVNTVVNYSISIGLGIAGTVEGQINFDGKNLLNGYHAAQYVGIGLSGFGIGIALLFCLGHWLKRRERLRANLV